MNISEQKKQKAKEALTRLYDKIETGEVNVSGIECSIVGKELMFTRNGISALSEKQEICDGLSLGVKDGFVRVVSKKQKRKFVYSFIRE